LGKGRKATAGEKRTPGGTRGSGKSADAVGSGRTKSLLEGRLLFVLDSSPIRHGHHRSSVHCIGARGINLINFFWALFPIEWVERVPQYSPPRGCVPPMAGQNRREQPGFRRGCLASARHLSPNPFRKTESQFRSRQPKHFPTRTHERTGASLCPAMGGMRPLGPSRDPPPWQRACRPMQNRPKSPTRLGEDSFLIPRG